jgi:hypothetical protein
MRIKIEAEVEITDEEILDAIDRDLIKGRAGVIAALNGAEFRIDLDDLNFQFNIVDAEAH